MAADIINMTVAELFNEDPFNWGLRGDAYLWAELQQRLAGTPMPETPAQLQQLLEAEYEAATGYSLSYTDEFTIERFMHGGLSSGQISPDFWNHEGIPLLVSRHPGDG